LKKNLLALVLVAIVCAIAAQYLRQGGQNKEWTALRVDMVDALERFWNTRGHQVELLPADKGVTARVQVVMPADTNGRQQQWNFPVLRFVAQRNRTPELVGLSLSTPQGALQEAGPQGASQGAVPAVPYAGGESVEAHLELVQRQAQAWLDGVVGAGNSLALVDGSSRQVAQPVAPGVEAHYLRAREESEGKRAPSSDNSSIAPQVVTTKYTTILVVVANGRAEGVEAKLSRLPELESSLQLKLNQGDSRRLVVLP